MVNEMQTAEDIILEEGLVAGFASIMQGIQEIQDYATDVIFPTDSYASETNSPGADRMFNVTYASTYDEEASVTSTTCSCADASRATDKSSRKSVSWFDDEMNNCNVEVKYGGTNNKLKEMLKKKLSLNVVSSGKRNTRKNRRN